MKRAIQVVMVLALALGMKGQTPPYTISLSQQPLPIPQNVSASYSGTVGQTSYWYWVIANYGVGDSQPSTPVVVNKINASGTVTIVWAAPASPSDYTLSYDVLRTTSATFPANGSCSSCLVVTTSTLSATDTLGALANYALATYQAQNTPMSITLDNVNSTAVLFKGIVNGQTIFKQGASGLSPIAGNGLIGSINGASTIYGLASASFPLGFTFAGDTFGNAYIQGIDGIEMRINGTPIVNVGAGGLSTTGLGVTGSVTENGATTIARKFQTFGNTCTTGAAVGALCDVSYTWSGTAFTDANYVVVCSLSGTNLQGIPMLQKAYSKSTTQFAVTIVTPIGLAAQSSGVDCIAWR